MFKSVQLLLFGVILIASCSNNAVFDELKSISDNGWNAKEKLSFIVPINDTSNAFDIFIHVRNSSEYEFSNLWLFLTSTAPNGNVLQDTVEFILADPGGQWLGTGLGSVNAMLIPYKTNIRFPNRGIYTFSIQQGMRQELLNKIIDIGIRIETHN